MSFFLKQPSEVVPTDWPCKCGGSVCPCPPAHDISFLVDDGAYLLTGTLTYYPPSSPPPSSSDPAYYVYVGSAGGISFDISVRCGSGYTWDVMYDRGDGDVSEYHGDNNSIVLCNSMDDDAFMVRFEVPGLYLQIYWGI